MRIARPYIFWSVLSSLVLATAARGSIAFVDDDAAPGGDGLSWATALASLQTAIIEATGDSPITEIRVAAGTYLPDAAMDRTATFALRTGVAIRGGFAGHGAVDPDARDVTQFVSILTGDLAGDDEPVDLDPFAGTDENSYHVVTATDVDTTAMLDGFVVEAGNSLGSLSESGGGVRVTGVGAPTLTNLVIRRNQAMSGAGVWLGGGTALLANSVIEGNAAQRGGGVGISGIDRPTVSGCTIANNRADHGGGIWLDFFAALVIDCDIRDNEATLNGGGIGGGVGVIADIVASTIAHNAAGERGGGVFLDLGARSRIWQSVFFANSATDGAGLAVIAGSQIDLANTQLNGNVATNDGGGVWWLDSAVSVSNCTIYGNTAFLGGGVHGTSVRFLDDITIRNSILWANQGTSGRGPQISLGIAPLEEFTVDTLIVDSCDVEEGESRVFISTAKSWQVNWRPTNIVADPLFVDPDGPDLSPDSGDEDFRIMAASPCIDAGVNTVLPADAFDLDDDGDVDEPLPIDLGGDPRIAPTMCHEAPNVDIGAFEYGLRCCPVNRDGRIGFQDRIRLLLTWGPCPECMRDPHASGPVGFIDVDTLLRAKGTCPTR